MIERLIIHTSPSKSRDSRTEPQQPNKPTIKTSAPTPINT
jgi:hypothetical protein